MTGERIAFLNFADATYHSFVQSGRITALEYCLTADPLWHVCNPGLRPCPSEVESQAEFVRVLDWFWAEVSPLLGERERLDYLWRILVRHRERWMPGVLGLLSRPAN